MNDGTKKIIAWIVLILVVVGIFLGLYFVFKNGVLGKAFGGLFGTLAGVTSAFDKMVQGCNKNGWANPKNCPLGFTGILVGSLFAVAGIYKFIRWGRTKATGPEGSTKSMVEKSSAVTGKDALEIQDGLIAEYDGEKIRLYVEENGEAKAILAIKTSGTKKLAENFAEEVKSRGLDEEQVAEMNVMKEDLITNYVNDAFDAGVPKDDARQIADSNEDFFADPV